MLVPRSWLADYLGELPALDDLVAMLDDLGLVVEGVRAVGSELAGVVVARVEAIDPIEGADRIRLATVFDGERSTEVVCGAWNYEVGSLVPFAPVGTVLPNGMEIARRTMRGKVSNGMLCSGRELEVGDDHEGLLVLDGRDGAVPGAPVAGVLGVPDVVLDVSVEGNRPDAWCVEGVARDLAARMGRSFTPVEPTDVPAADPVDLSVSIGDPDLCGRLTATLLHDVVVGPSPQWIVDRLERCGMRAVNNVVDASNYVMLELGQPTHPYDLAALHGGLGARRAREHERLVLLDGTELELAVGSGALGDTGEDLVIVDGTDVAVGLAGIMGGATSGIEPTTSAVALEAAWFEPMAIARSAKRHRLRTEASSRFERGADPEAALRAARRVAELLAISSPSLRRSPTVDVRGELPVPPRIELDQGALAGRLGVDVPLAEAARLLGAIGFGVEPHGRGLTVTPPTGRPDVRPSPYGVADVAEEVARLHGYARITPVVPSWPQPGSLEPQVAARRSVRDALVGLGALEAWSATMVSRRDAELLGDETDRVLVTNPMSADEPALRSSLLPGLLAVLRHNVERRQGDVALFETGNVFVHPAYAPAPRIERGGEGGGELLKLPTEDERVALVLGRPGDDATTAVAAWRCVADALRLAGVRLERDERETPPRGVHPTRYARILDQRSGEELGVVGEVDPELVARALPTLAADRRVGWLDCSLAALTDPQRATRRAELAEQPSRFPSSDLDLALVVGDDVNVERVKSTLRDAAGALCESVSCFDAYRGAPVPAGSRSLAIRVRLCAPDHTLSEEELGGLRAAMIAAATERLGASLR